MRRLAKLLLAGSLGLALWGSGCADEGGEDKYELSMSIEGKAIGSFPNGARLLSYELIRDGRSRVRISNRGVRTELHGGALYGDELLMEMPDGRSERVQYFVQSISSGRVEILIESDIRFPISLKDEVGRVSVLLGQQEVESWPLMVETGTTSLVLSLETPSAE